MSICAVSWNLATSLCLDVMQKRHEKLVVENEKITQVLENANSELRLLKTMRRGIDNISALLSSVMSRNPRAMEPGQVEELVVAQTLLKEKFGHLQTENQALRTQLLEADEERRSELASYSVLAAEHEGCKIRMQHKDDEIAELNEELTKETRRANDATAAAFALANNNLEPLAKRREQPTAHCSSFIELNVGSDEDMDAPNPLISASKISRFPSKETVGGGRMQPTVAGESSDFLGKRSAVTCLSVRRGREGFGASQLTICIFIIIF